VGSGLRTWDQSYARGITPTCVGDSACVRCTLSHARGSNSHALLNLSPRARCLLPRAWRTSDARGVISHDHLVLLPRLRETFPRARATLPRAWATLPRAWATLPRAWESHTRVGDRTVRGDYHRQILCHVTTLLPRTWDTWQHNLY
jgi:hypothetical protein